MSRNEKLYLCKFILWLAITISNSIVTIISVNLTDVHWAIILIAVIYIFANCCMFTYYGSKFIDERNTAYQKLDNIERWLQPTIYENNVVINRNKK